MIEFLKVSKSFGSNEVISDFSLVCKAGMITALVGRNGAGKSTLVNLAMGLLRLDRGEVRILGEKVDRRNRSVVKHVGYVLEEPLYVESFSAREQLEFVGRLHQVKNLKERINELLAFFDLPIDNDKLILQYSAGNKAKVSLACAVIHSPKILILDEPFNGLDLLLYDKLLSYLKDYAAKGNCILITTHQVDVITELSDYVALIKTGKLHFHYSFTELQEMASSFQHERSPLKKYLTEQLAETI